MSQDVKAAKLAKLQKQFFDLSVEAAREEVRKQNEKIKHSLDMEKQERILQNNLDLQRMVGAQQEARERAQSKANAKTQRQNMMMGLVSLLGQGALAFGTGGASLGLGAAGALGTFGKVAAGASAVGNLVGTVGSMTGNREMAQAGQLTGAMGQFGGAMGGLMSSGTPAQGGNLTPEQRGQLLASGGKELTGKQMTAILNNGGPEALNRAMQGNAFAIPQQTQQQGQHPNAYFNQMYNNPMIEGNNYIGRQIMQGGEDGGFSFKNALLLGGGKALQEIGDLGRFTYETEAGKHGMTTAKSDAYRRGTDLLKTSYDRDATYENTGRVNQAAMEQEVYRNEQQNRRQREKFELDKLLAMADHLGKKNLLAYEHNLKKQETKKSLENIKGLNSYLGSVLGSAMSDNQKTEIVNSLLPDFINSGDNRFMGVLSAEVQGDKIKLNGARGVQSATFDIESVLQATGSNEGLQTYYPSLARQGVYKTPIQDVKLHTKAEEQFYNDKTEYDTAVNLIQSIQEQGADKFFTKNTTEKLGGWIANTTNPSQNQDFMDKVQMGLANTVLSPMQKAMMERTQTLKSTKARGLGYRATSASDKIIAPTINDTPEQAFLHGLQMAVSAKLNAENIANKHGATSGIKGDTIKVYNLLTKQLGTMEITDALTAIQAHTVLPVINGKPTEVIG